MKGKHCSRSKLDNRRDAIISLLRAAKFFLIEMRMGLFRGTGRTLTVLAHTFLTLPSPLRLCRISPCNLSKPSTSLLITLQPQESPFCSPNLLKHPSCLCPGCPFCLAGCAPRSLQNGFSLIIQISAPMSSPQRCLWPPSLEEAPLDSPFLSITLYLHCYI